MDPKTVAACAAAQVRAAAPQLLAAGFTSVSVMSKRGKLAPLRTVFYYEEGEWGFKGRMRGVGGCVLRVQPEKCRCRRKVCACR